MSEYAIKRRNIGGFAGNGSPGQKEQNRDSDGAQIRCFTAAVCTGKKEKRFAFCKICIVWNYILFTFFKECNIVGVAQDNLFFCGDGRIAYGNTGFSYSLD